MLLSCKNFILPDFTRKKIFAQENDGSGGGGGGGGDCCHLPPFLYGLLPVWTYWLFTIYFMILKILCLYLGAQPFSESNLP